MKKDLIKQALEISSQANSESAVEFQKELVKYIQLKDDFKKRQFIAGVDLAYTADECFCSIVVVDATTMKVVERAFSKNKIRFPYIPGLLFYREFPAFYDAYLGLQREPDILMFDGQGLSHQRMMGIATMAGILLEKPTIGCAKSHLYSDGYQIPENKKFAVTELRLKGTLIGYVLRSKENVKPIFISTGHRISPETSLKIVEGLITNFKLPLPTYYAHKESEARKAI